MVKQLYSDITGVSNVLSASVSSSHRSATSVLVVEAKDKTIGLGDSISADLGYTTAFDTVFTGYVKQIERSSSTGVWTISAHDEMVRAVDYFLASSKPDDPFRREDIKAEFLVRDLLEEAGLTNYAYDATNFTFATKQPLEINLVGVYDFCKQIADILTWHIYADNSGQIHFVDRKPYVMGGDSASHTITDSNILSATEITTDRDLRNRVVVYGRGSVSAESKATSPYLPSGFYKTVVLATDLIDKYVYAKRATNYNLDLLNRLGELVNLKLEGDSSISARQIVNVTDTVLGLSDDYYVYGLDHNWSKEGFTTDLVVKK